MYVQLVTKLMSSKLFIAGIGVLSLISHVESSSKSSLPQVDIATYYNRNEPATSSLFAQDPSYGTGSMINTTNNPSNVQLLNKGTPVKAEQVGGWPKYVVDFGEASAYSQASESKESQLATHLPSLFDRPANANRTRPTRDQASSSVISFTNPPRLRAKKTTSLDSDALAQLSSEDSQALAKKIAIIEKAILSSPLITTPGGSLVSKKSQTIEENIESIEALIKMLSLANKRLKSMKLQQQQQISNRQSTLR